MTEHSNSSRTQSAAASYGVVEMDTAECWALMQHGLLGRFAIEDANGAPNVFPVNYLIHEGSVYVRSAPGSKLSGILANPEVAFEIDGDDGKHWWSVVIRGTARLLDSDDEIAASGILHLESWSPTPKFHFIQVSPRSVTGRRFPKPLHPHNPGRAVLGSSSNPPLVVHDSARSKPRPIPHFPPLWNG